MSKLILAGLCAVAALGLTGCKGAEENNLATENLEEMNATDDFNMDMNADMNATDMNAVDANAMDSATGNDAVDNAAGNAY